MELREGDGNKKSKGRKKRKVSKSVTDLVDDDAGDRADESESVVSGDEAPSEYESMLQKYEAEVRNHIKIEQQLKLHIECVQDKLEDQEKLLKKE